MAPPKILAAQTRVGTVTSTTGVMTRRGLATRQQSNVMNTQVEKQQPALFKDTRIKRKAEASPLKDKVTKRSALGNITNVSFITDTFIFFLYYQMNILLS